MYILTISGSSAQESTNTKLLESFNQNFSGLTFKHYDIKQLPLYLVDLDINPLPSEVKQFRKIVSESAVVIISTPEYTHNIPAILKSALEWLTTSGELAKKKVIAITYTPNTPRGEKAMSSLIQTLKALDAQVLTNLDLYLNEIWVNEDGKLAGDLELLTAAIKLIS